MQRNSPPCFIISLESSISRRSHLRLPGNMRHCKLYPAFSHKIPWLGCGKSYREITRKSLLLGFDKILLLEDDVSFPKTFSKRYSTLLSLFQKFNYPFDVFSGLLAEIHDFSVVYTPRIPEKNTIIQLDRFMSMTFNIFRRKSQCLLSVWMPSKGLNLWRDTIDRYLQRNYLKIWTTSPFLIRHSNDLNSTLWNIHNSQYHYTITRSERQIMKFLPNTTY